MVQATIAHLTSLTSSNISQDLFCFKRKFVLSECLFLHDIHTILWSLPLRTTVGYSPLHAPHQLWPLIFTPFSHLVPPPKFFFFFFSITYHYHLHPNSPHMHPIFSSIYGIRMPSKHSKPTHIHGNTISKFIPQHHHNRNTSKLPCDSYRHFTDFSSREYGPLKNKTYKFTFYTHKQNFPLHYY